MTQVGSRVLSGSKAMLASYGGVRAVLRTFGPVALLDAGLREAWLRIGSFIWRLLGNQRRQDYGLLEAILFPAQDYWLRYQRVIGAASAISRQEPLEILEVGSGRAGVALFIKPGAARVCMVDQAATNVLPRHSAEARYVRADACHLPFADASFAVVISVDTLEHIPRPARAAFLRELKRVTKEAVILTCPLDSQDGRFQAGKADARLREELKEQNRRVPRWLDEHLQWGHPMVEEVAEELEGARIEGWQNCELWRRFQVLQLRPFLWPVAGLFYLLALKKHDSSPPYWRGMVTWQKEATVTAEDEAARHDQVGGRRGVDASNFQA
jgi:SAM-dependent methyltransferase